MQIMLSRLAGEGGGSHLLEYAILALCISAALIQPSLFLGVLSRVGDVMRLMVGQVLALL